MSEGMKTLDRDYTIVANPSTFREICQWAQTSTYERQHREQNPVFEYAIHTLTPDVRSFGRHLFTQMRSNDGRELLEDMLLDVSTRQEMQEYITDLYVKTLLDKLQSLYGCRALLGPY